MDHEGEAKWVPRSGTVEEYIEYYRCPYVVRNTIELHLDIPYDGRTTKATILKVFEPFTLSCVMVVRLSCSALALEGDMVLKFIDRRLAKQLREDEMIKPWTSDIEKGHHRFILDGGAAKFIHMLNTDHGKASEDSDKGTDSQIEADAHEHMSGFYKSEVQVYNISRLCKILTYLNTLHVSQRLPHRKHKSASISLFLESFGSTMKGFAWLTLLHTPRERAGNSSVKTRSGLSTSSLNEEY